MTQAAPSAGLDQLVNTGIRSVGDADALAANEKTLIVVGPGRGGTSLVAGTLHHLGVFMGDGSEPPVFEDRRLAGPCQSNRPGKVAAIMREYDDAHSIWGYKRPSIIDHFDIVHEHARNPVYLFIFKDVFSIANRNAISMQFDVLKGLRMAQRAYGKIIDFIAEREPNGLLFSYDRIMRDEAEFVDTLTQLLPTESTTDTNRAAALQFIEPNPTAYLERTRVTRAIGAIDTFDVRAISGWCAYDGRPDHLPEVELSISNEVRATARAERADTQGPYHYHFAIEPSLQVGQRVELRLTEDVVPFATRTWERPD